MEKADKRELIEALSNSQDGNPIKRLFDKNGDLTEDARERVWKGDHLSAFLARAIGDAFADGLDMEQVIDNLRNRLRYAHEEITKAQDALRKVASEVYEISF